MVLFYRAWFEHKDPVAALHFFVFVFLFVGDSLFPSGFIYWLFGVSSSASVSLFAAPWPRAAVLIVVASVLS